MGLKPHNNRRSQVLGPCIGRVVLFLLFGHRHDYPFRDLYMTMLRAECLGNLSARFPLLGDRVQSLANILSDPIYFLRPKMGARCDCGRVRYRRLYKGET